MSLKVTEQQLPLDFKNTQTKTFIDFLEGKNFVVLKSLKSFIDSDETLFYLWGETGSGKTHLLQAYVTQLLASEKTAVIIKPSELDQRQNVQLIEMFDIVCIDNVENIAQNKAREEALFFWINEIKQAGKKIILAGQLSNNSPQWQLPDLRSRLQAGRTHELKTLNREDSLTVFKQQAENKGIKIDSKIENYLKNNCDMNMSYLSSLLVKLDEATLVEKKQVTIPLLKKIVLEK